jgi:hypothetical protein
MKTAIISLLLAASGAQADPLETKIYIIKDQTSPVTVELDTNTVRCSEVGYGLSNLKVSVPELKFLAHFDHSTPGDINPFPCITAGMCATPWNPTGPTPATLIRADQPTEAIQVRIVLKETYLLDHTAQTCHRTLQEDVTTTIRGLDFYHHREARFGQFPYAACQVL